MGVPNDPVDATLWDLDEEASPFEGADTDDDFELDGEGLKDAFGLPDRLPPVRLPAEPELAAMCRAVPLLKRAHRLAQWAAPGRDLTLEEELTAADTVAAAAELGIAVPAGAEVAPKTSPGTPAPPAVATMHDVRELARLWELALDVGFLELDVSGSRVAPGEMMDNWPGGTDEEALGVWTVAMASVLHRLEEEAVLDARHSRLLDFTGVGAALMIMMFLARAEGVPVSEASDVIRQAVAGGLAEERAARAWQSWTGIHGDPAEDVLGQLAELGAVSLAGQPSGEGRHEGPVAQLTPLGTWDMREQLEDEGVEIPLLPPPGQMTAADLLAAAEDLESEELEAETAAWLELRAPDVAAAELLAAAAGTDPTERLIAIDIVNRLGKTAEPAWRDALGRPELRGYATIALTEIAGGEPGVDVIAGLEPDLADLAWLLIDMVTAFSDEPDELAQQIRDSIPAGQEQEMFDAMSASPHPDAAGALSLIGQHHPDKQMAKAARRSAHRAASRPKPTP
jgi:hypothetical protein